MASLLCLSIPAFPAIPLLGGREGVGGRVAVHLSALRERMVPRRDVLAKSAAPPATVALPPWYSEIRRREKLRYLAGMHKRYLDLEAAIAEVGAATGDGADLELTATLHSYKMAMLEYWSGLAILEGDFVWAECRACVRRYGSGECHRTEWRLLADPMAGFGGGWLSCPVDHLLFARQTWVA